MDKTPAPDRHGDLHGGCKICGAAAPLFGRVDFHRSCEDGNGPALPASGTLVDYRRCVECQFLFTTDFDAWPVEAFAARIYNDAYGLVDPDYREARPARMAALVAKALGSERPSRRLLDYGGGSGRLAQLVRAAGFDAESWDPFVQGGAPPARQYGLVTCFEVLEHAPDPAATMAQIAGLVAPGGMLFFSTLLQPADIGAQGMGWWYIAPRNGHVSLYSSEALRRLLDGQGMVLHSVNPGLHYAVAA